jgi:hypothetical protein
MMFRQLNSEEVQQFRAWARENYKTGDPIPGIWHPVIQEECAKINREKATFVFDTHPPEE